MFLTNLTKYGVNNMYNVQTVKHNDPFKTLVHHIGNSNLIIVTNGSLILVVSSWMD